jgi:hypothetical protein
LTIEGKHFACDRPTDENGRHDGWAHTNTDAGAVWSGNADRLAVAVDD